MWWMAWRSKVSLSISWCIKEQASSVVAWASAGPCLRSVSTLCRSCAWALREGLGINHSERAMVKKFVYPLKLAMAAPTITFIADDQGGMWEVTYAGMVRQHRQEWQAWCWYQMAQAAYAVCA